ncbi:MAG: hypothetical protein PHC64_03220 [Candidatus Gastranaerophilales bacterium]|nr:hypothetical protein [Candidatus Gastranaerophilales bacterium]
MDYYFIGLMLASGANAESGVAVVDKNNQIILLDKLFTIQDVQYFFDNFSSLKNARICISLPWENSMLNGKWRLFSKLYQPLGLGANFHNTDNWTQRYSNRGSDYFTSLVEQGIKINRFELYLTRQALGLESCFKERSPADCKALQSALKIKYGFHSLLSNMMPMAQLEALVGAILAKKLSEEAEKPIFEFNGIPVVRG